MYCRDDFIIVSHKASLHRLSFGWGRVVLFVLRSVLSSWYCRRDSTLAIAGEAIAVMIKQRLAWWGWLLLWLFMWKHITGLFQLVIYRSRVIRTCNACWLFGYRSKSLRDGLHLVIKNLLLCSHLKALAGWRKCVKQARSCKEMMMRKHSRWRATEPCALGSWKFHQLKISSERSRLLSSLMQRRRINE